MKKVVVSLFLFLFLFNLAIALDEPISNIDSEDVEDMQQAIDYIPIDDSSKINYDEFKPFKTKADERIEKINKYVGPITKILWGVELSLSWIFIFSFVLWILLIELIVMPVSEILDFNIVGSLVGAGIIATLAMQGLGKDFIIWIDSIVTQWYIGIVVLGFGAIFMVAYSIFTKYLGMKIKTAKEKAAKEQTDRDRKYIHADAEITEKNLKS